MGDEHIYDQLNTKTLGDVEAIDIQSLQDKVHIQKVNVDALETYNLINQATFRDDAGIIPSSSIVVKACSSEGSDAPSTSLTYYLYLRHGVLDTGPPEDVIDIYVGATSSGSTVVSLSGLLADIGGNGPFLIDEYASLVFDVSAMQGVTRFDIYTYMARIR